MGSGFFTMPRLRRKILFNQRFQCFPDTICRYDDSDSRIDAFLLKGRTCILGYTIDIACPLIEMTMY